jgi:hypothetical protein
MTGSITCIWQPMKSLIREHARCGGFPANTVSRVIVTIDPTTAAG